MGGHTKVGDIEPEPFVIESELEHETRQKIAQLAADQLLRDASYSPAKAHLRQLLCPEATDRLVIVDETLHESVTQQNLHRQCSIDEKKECFNIMVAGASGIGKSSFVDLFLMKFNIKEAEKFFQGPDWKVFRKDKDGNVVHDL